MDGKKGQENSVKFFILTILANSELVWTTPCITRISLHIPTIITGDVHMLY